MNVQTLCQKSVASGIKVEHAENGDVYLVGTSFENLLIPICSLGYTVARDVNGVACLFNGSTYVGVIRSSAACSDYAFAVFYGWAMASVEAE